MFLVLIMSCYIVLLLPLLASSFIFLDSISAFADNFDVNRGRLLVSETWVCTHDTCVIDRGWHTHEVTLIGLLDVRIVIRD